MKPVKHHLYHLNLQYKERVKDKLNKMLDARFIDPVEELEWISPMVMQDKKTDEVQICVYLRKLNDACLDDQFLTPFTDEVLEGVGGQEIYSLANVF